MSNPTSKTVPSREPVGSEQLPLKPVVYLLLLALSRGERHGYLLNQEVTELSEGTVSLDPGTLYRWLGRLLDDGWVDRAPPPDGSPEDPRRRYYRLSPLGERLLELESARLRRLMAAVPSGGAVQ